MKNTKNITLCAVISALSAVFMLLGYFPYFTYAVPAVAGLFFIVPLIEINKKYALFSYIVSSVLVLLIAEPETKVLFVLLFGYYPIIKAVIEKLKKPVCEWLIKIAVFNISVLLCYAILKLLTNIDVDDFGVLGKYGAYIFLMISNIAFVLYDIAISKVTVFYLWRLHGKVENILKTK